MTFSKAVARAKLYARQINEPVAVTYDGDMPDDWDYQGLLRPPHIAEMDLGAIVYPSGAVEHFRFC